jgi:hypothetical protein
MVPFARTADAERAQRMDTLAVTKRAPGFYAGLALTAGATLALEILQVRILSVVSWYHLAFFVISIAMFGLTAGALFVFARPGLFAEPDAPAASRSSRWRPPHPLAYLDQITLERRWSLGHRPGRVPEAALTVSLRSSSREWW